MANIPWTEDQKAYLLAERAKGTPVPVIAKALGKPVPATYTRCRMLGSKIQIHTPWSADLETRLHDLATGPVALTDQELADAIGKPVGQMRWKLADLGLVAKRTKRPKAERQSPAQDTARIRTVEAPKDRIEKAAVIGDFSQAQARKKSPSQTLDRAASEILAQNRRRLKEDNAARVRAETASARHEAAAKRKTEREAAAASAKAKKEQAAIKRAEEKRQALARERANSARAIETVRAEEEARSRKKAERGDNEKPIGILPVAPKADEVKKTSGRGGWMETNTGKRRHKGGPPPSRDASIALSRHAQDAVTQFMKERGVTRGAKDPIEEAINYLRRRGYIVVPQTDEHGSVNGWTVDHRHEITSAAALKTFAEARGHA